MRKKIDYIAIFFLFLIYIYGVNISFLPNEITILKGEELRFKSLYGINFSEVAKVSNEDVNKTKIEVNLFGIVNVKEIDITSIENYDVVPVRKNNRIKVVHKWSVNCWYDRT